jgi:predicted secreted protein
MESSRRAGLLAAAAALLMAGGPATVAADEGPGEAGRRVSFQVEAAREVESDWFRARVGVTVEDADAGRAAEQVNQAMQWALAQAKRVEAVRARSGGYATQPVYQEGRIRRWRASHELEIESGDAEALSTLLGTLQQKLALRSFEVSVSEARRQEVEEELVREALAAFRKRAAVVQESLGAGGYAIDTLAIATQGRAPIPVMRASALKRAPTQPALEGGTTRIAVSVQATIALE